MTFVEGDEELTDAINRVVERERIDATDARKIASELAIKFSLSRQEVIAALGNLCVSRCLLPAMCA